MKVKIRGIEYDVAPVDSSHVTLTAVWDKGGRAWPLHVAQLDPETAAQLKAGGFLDARGFVAQKLGGAP